MSQVVVISGAGSGIGAACAVRFARAGARVVLLGRRIDALQHVASQCGAVAMPIACDVTDMNQVAHALASVQHQLGRIDVLVSAAGTNLPERRVAQLTPASWQMMIDTNLNGAFFFDDAGLAHAPPRAGGDCGHWIDLGTTTE